MGQGRHVYMRRKPIHPEVIRHMSLGTLQDGIKNGIFYMVKEKEVKG